MSARSGGAVAERVGPVLRAAEQRLRNARLATARQDAERLLARVLGATRLALHLAPDRPIATAALDRFEAMLARRAGHEPLQYILGEEEFLGVRIDIAPGVFIPRPETELLVERALTRCPTGPAIALDLCTGSGVVACVLAARRPRLTVWAVELASDAVRCATANVARLGLAARVRVVTGDLFDSLAGLDLAGRCDLVVGNPPYLAGPSLRGLPDEVRLWEPAVALDGGVDGLAVVDRIVAGAPCFTRPGGRLLLEVGHDHAGPLRARLAADPRYGLPVFHRDLLGYERVLEVEVR